MTQGIEGKIVVITGASSGLGEAAARLLSQQGAKVVLGARRLDRLQPCPGEAEDAPSIHISEFEKAEVVMSPRFARLLTRFYSSEWRARYGEEFARFLEESPASVKVCFDVAKTGLHESLVQWLRLHRGSFQEQGRTSLFHVSYFLGCDAVRLERGRREMELLSRPGHSLRYRFQHPRTAGEAP